MPVPNPTEYLAAPLAKARVATLAAASGSGTIAAPSAAELAAAGADGATYYRLQILLQVGDRNVNAVRIDPGQSGVFSEMSVTTAGDGNVLSRPIPIGDDVDWALFDVAADGAAVLAADAFVSVLVPQLSP